MKPIREIFHFHHLPKLYIGFKRFQVTLMNQHMLEHVSIFLTLGISDKYQHVGLKFSTIKIDETLFEDLSDSEKVKNFANSMPSASNKTLQF